MSCLKGGLRAAHKLDKVVRILSRGGGGGGGTVQMQAAS